MGKLLSLHETNPFRTWSTVSLHFWLHNAELQQNPKAAHQVRVEMQYRKYIGWEQVRSAPPEHHE